MLVLEIATSTRGQELSGELKSVSWEKGGKETRESLVGARLLALGESIAISYKSETEERI